ncbi:hypothetical protein MSG28_015294 [Choristoneura fumiferana]|uniref:Uncharacterized protein n=1 Tax=Choristoneura fumiferana TaxID=7141 RepID=A0ACC0K9T5_CHOFU|nr:hypothetical protein MSG28_015294 [Choristoneura fumiferana]
MESTNMTSEWVTTVTIVKEEPVEVPECDVVIEEEPKDYSGALLANRDLKKGDSSPKESEEVNTNSLNKMIEAVPKEDCDAAVEDWPPYPDVKVEVLLDAPPPSGDRHFYPVIRLRHLRQSLQTKLIIIPSQKTAFRWPCPLCPSRSWSPAHLRIHLRVHSGARPACCHVCGARLATAGNLRRHLLAHAGERPHTCPHCGNRFTQKSVLIKHIRIHTGETPFSCNICHKKFSRSFTLACHLRIHGEKYVKELKPKTQIPPESWTCELCNKTFKNKAYRHTHMQIHTRVKEFSCEMCQKTFANFTNLEKHMKVHSEKGRTCTVCGKEFKTQANLARHMLVHTGERPFPCSFCEMRFTQKSVLVKHERVHTGELPYTCEICLKKFARSFTLDNHLKRVHKKVRNRATAKYKDGRKEMLDEDVSKDALGDVNDEKPKICDTDDYNEDSVQFDDNVDSDVACDINKKEIVCETKPYWCGNCDSWHSTSDEFYKHECTQADNVNLSDNEIVAVKEENNVINGNAADPIDNKAKSKKAKKRWTSEPRAAGPVQAAGVRVRAPLQRARSPTAARACARRAAPACLPALRQTVRSKRRLNPPPPLPQRREALFLRHMPQAVHPQQHAHSAPAVASR